MLVGFSQYDPRLLSSSCSIQDRAYSCAGVGARSRSRSIRSLSSCRTSCEPSVVSEKREGRSSRAFRAGWRGSGVRRGWPVICVYNDSFDIVASDPRWFLRASQPSSWYSGRLGCGSGPPRFSTGAKCCCCLCSRSSLMSRSSSGTIHSRRGGWCPKSRSPKRRRRVRQLRDASSRLAAANAFVACARFLRMRRRQRTTTRRKMKAQPSVMSRICHHSSDLVVVTVVVELMPVMLGKGVLVELEGVVTTRSERHSPRPEITLLELLHPADTQVPPRRIWLELEHAKQLFAPDPEQLEQLESHDWQEDDAVSKNCDCEHVGRQRPLLRTGRSEGQLEHWLKEVPEQVAQSGWQARHAPEELTVLEGQEDTQVPLDAS